MRRFKGIIIITIIIIIRLFMDVKRSHTIQ